MTQRSLVALIAALAAAGCVGNIGDGARGNGSGSGTAQGPGGETLGTDDTRRLSPAEYETTLRSLFGDEPVDAALVQLATLPDDRGKNEFSTMERGITAGHIETYYGVAKAVSDVVSVDPVLRQRVDPCLGDALPDAACVESAVDAFSLRAFRRPLAEDERADILASYEAGASQLSFEDGLALALMTILESPYFLYHVEVGGSVEPAARYDLDGYELAARLSYFLTGGPPDDTLLAAAAEGALDDETRYDAEVERLLGSDLARLQVRRFFTEWLSLDRIPVAQASVEFLAGVDPSAAAQEMRTELEMLVDYHVFEQGSGFGDLMRSDLAYPGANLESIYGLATSGPPALVSITDGHRAGLLTRAAFLSTTSETTHPVQRAAFVIRRLLCDDIEMPPPSAGLEITPPAYDPGKTARERWTARTSGGSCSTCHERINPFGFALEKYDSLGRFRSKEPIIDPDTGAVVNQLPIDDTVTVRIGSTETTVEGGVGLSDALAESDLARDCMTRKWFRFTHGRRETDGEFAFVAGQDDPERAVYEMLAAVTGDPGFRVRNVGGGEP